MTPRDIGLLRGRKASGTVENLAATMAATFKHWRILYPTAGEVDHAAAIRDIDRERLECQPDLTRFPELRGHTDLLRAEREAFREVTGLDETATAFHFSNSFYFRRRLDTRHLARYDLLPPPGDEAEPGAPDAPGASGVGCTGIYFPKSAEGGAIMGQNGDVWLDPDSFYASFRPEEVLQQSVPNLIMGGGSCAVLMDDEPECSYPADPFDYELIPEEVLQDVDQIADFLERYNEFWGPGNCIVVDRRWRGVVIEKSNCMMAVRRPVVNGACAATACAYLDPKLSAHQLEQARKAMRIKGHTEEDSPDVNFHLGAGKRYRRLLELVAAEAARGATLWGAMEIISDHDAPFPEHICVAGETVFPEHEKTPNWTVQHQASVISGPNKRCLYRSIQSFAEAKPVYHYQPKLMLGPGVKMQPQWQADADAGRCELAGAVAP